MSLEIGKVLYLSTIHLSDETCTRMEYSKNLALTIYPFTYGWWVYVGGILPTGDVPDDLIACMKLAIENDCDWIKFDNDVEPIEELEEYEW